MPTNEITVTPESFIKHNPIFPVLQLTRDSWFIVIYQYGLEVRTTPRTYKTVKVALECEDLDAITFSSLQQRVVVKVDSRNEKCKSYGIVPGAVLTQCNRKTVQPSSNVMDLIAKYGSDKLEFEVPEPYPTGCDTMAIIPCLEKFQLHKTNISCIHATFENEDYYIELENIQEPGWFESVDSWESVNLKPRMECIVMHDMLGVTQDSRGKVKESNVLSGGRVMIETVDMYHKLAVISVKATRLTVRICSEEGRPALRPADDTVIHYPEITEEDEGDACKFDYDDEEVERFAANQEKRESGTKAAGKGRRQMRPKSKPRPRRSIVTEDNVPGKLAKHNSTLSRGHQKVGPGPVPTPRKSEGVVGQGAPKAKAKAVAKKPSRKSSAPART
eukprot:GEMP01028860.1.p1 GENE.GEMP01028860.1~~GEMP01028860.1.p1  ORF type:complete len:388 (+),score=91.90 GEMP01028860.1:158-1321(+)